MKGMYSATIARVWRMALLPAIFYFIFFCILTYPLIQHVATDCTCDRGDGYQYNWRLWWVNKAITELHQTPWETSYLYYPTGLHLIVDDLDTLNGIIGIGLIRFVALPQVYNLIMIAGFVLSGLTLFWLAHYLTASYYASLLAGVIFTFSNYHFAQTAMGHLSTLTMYWIPVFVSCWLRLLHQPSLRRAVVAALTLGALMLTHLYFLFYAVLIGVFIVIWYLFKRRDVLALFRPTHLRPMLTFVVLTLLMFGPFFGAYIAVNRADPIVVDPFGTDAAAGHQAQDYSVDVLALFLPAGRTGEAVFSQIAGFPVKYTYAEHNAYPGWIVWGTILLLLLRWRKWEQDKAYLSLWYVMLIVFILISFGPILHVVGTEVPGIPMPYTLLEKMVPLFGSSGVPGRISVMSILCAAVIAAFGFKMVLENYQERRLVGALITSVLLVGLALDYWPLSLPMTGPDVPAYVPLLRDRADHGALIDGVTPAASAMYYQTLHDHPLAFAYTSRVTQSVRQSVSRAKALLDRGEYASLCRDFNYRYLMVAPTATVNPADGKALYADSTVALYELTCSP